MLKLQTPVTDMKCRVGISYDDKIMFLGSCFSDNIGRQLSDYGFDVCVNPFGTLYNPLSILNSVRRLIEQTPFTSEDCIRIGAGDGRFCSFSHHTSFAADTSEEFLSRADAALKSASEYFRSCTKVVITLGTSWCFRHIASDMIVSNCLKRDAKEFTREFISAVQTSEALREIKRLCSQAASADEGFVPKNFIFTVSPIRHFKDGAHGNQLSKSALLLGVNEVMSDNSDYFPAYEIMMDELRDYRFYAEDMCHPSSQAVDYIRERFLRWALPENEQETLNERIKRYKRSCHISKG